MGGKTDYQRTEEPGHILYFVQLLMYKYHPISYLTFKKRDLSKMVNAMFPYHTSVHLKLLMRTQEGKTVYS